MSDSNHGNRGVVRRRLLKAIGAFAVAPAFVRALSARAEGVGVVSTQMIRDAEWVSGLNFTDEDRELMRGGVNELLESYARLRDVPLANGDAPAIVFDPLLPEPEPSAGATSSASDDRVLPGPIPSDPPGSEEDLAFASVASLSGWLRAGKFSARDLTELAFRRLARYDPHLECVIESTASVAYAQADAADAALRSGKVRSALHGLPWGAKDLLSWPGTRTTWGAKPYENQRLEEKSAVGSRLEDAGAVLVAKLAVGALAWGDVWFGGTVRNPWNVEQGSSGSSAGPASAAAAGLVPFTIGTETWGSIVSPSTRCGTTGLRPTFGRVSGHGCMALTWTMDKIGPIARSAEDCAHVFAAIHGVDPRDRRTRSIPFRVPSPEDARGLRVGVLKDLFDVDWSADVEDAAEKQSAREWIAADAQVLRDLAKLDVELVEKKLPDDLPVSDLSLILTAEAATVFDELTRSGRDAELVRQVEEAWPNVFRQGQTIPAVEYLRATRIRRLVQQRVEEFFADIDVFVAPTFGGNHLLLTNLTGHPSLTMPNGFRSADGTPTSISFTGKLDGEEALLAVGQAWQSSTDHHLQRPPLDRLGADG